MRCSAHCTTSTGAATGASGSLAFATACRQRSRRHASGSISRVRYYAYLQWLADEQWQRVREGSRPGRTSFGDFPFMVSGHSADVWARQHEFDLEASVGTPPDAFSETGQDWGLPAYRWDVVALRMTLAGCAIAPAAPLSCTTAIRIDHLIGFFRTFVRKPGAAPGFWPGR